MGRIPQGTIDQILDRVDIVEVLSEYISLKKAGRNFKTCCPFHNEKTPSFVVSPDKQIFHCFGCSSGGNVIGFIMKYEGISFPEAARMLASRAGVEVPEADAKDEKTASLVKQIYEANDIAVKYYRAALRSPGAEKALKYLKDRGLDDETLEEFKVGYAPDEWEGLRKYCEKKNVSRDILQEAGLSIQSERGKPDYDRFRNRIMFPVFSDRGNVVAFGARVLDGNQPKYINSPETAVYSKSNVLYGLNFARKAIREKGRVLIVEGYTDVIVPYQHGVRNIVAASGTALTDRQALLLKKYTDTATMIFDADQAGEAASLRGLDILITNGLNVYIVTLPHGEDPDSFVRKNGAAAFTEAVSRAKDLFDYKLDLLMSRSSGSDIIARAKVVEEMLPTISKVPNAVIQSAYIEKLAGRLKLNEEVLRKELGKVKPDYSFRYDHKVQASASAKHKSSEVHLLGLAVLDRNMFEKITDEIGLDAFCDPDVKRAMGILENFYKEHNDPAAGKVLSRMEEDEQAKSAALKGIAEADISGDKQKVYDDCIARIKKDNMEERLKVLTAKLKEAEKMCDEPMIGKILMKISSIHKEKVA